jgi:hypothetical protein
LSAVLRFPDAPKPESRKTELVFSFRPKPVMSKFGLDETKKLLATTQRVDAGTQSILEFVDAHRDLAAQAGVETIGIELSSERAALGYAIDALEEGVKKGEGVLLSEGSLALLRRMEKLIAEASSNLSRFSGKALPRPAVMGQSQPLTDPIHDLLIPALFFGFVLVTVIVIASREASGNPKAPRKPARK